MLKRKYLFINEFFGRFFRRHPPASLGFRGVFIVVGCLFFSLARVIYLRVQCGLHAPVKGVFLFTLLREIYLWGGRRNARFAFILSRDKYIFGGRGGSEWNSLYPPPKIRPKGVILY